MCILSFDQYMQPWQCIALIILTIAVFFYASYLDDIKQTAESSLVALVEEKPSSSDEATESEKNTSTTWAEISLILNSDIVDDYALSFHQESLDSEKFHSSLFEELNKSPIAKDLILRPFTSELLEGNEIEILSSLMSIRPRSTGSMEIICKGHSTRAANLLSELIIRNYNRLITLESSDSPLPTSLTEKLEKYRELETQMEDLKIIIQEDLKGTPEESVEVMAIRSEIMQLDDDINQFKVHLLKIDEIHKDQLDPNEFLHIPPIRDFSNVSQLADILDQLKSMRLDNSLNEFTRNQVEKNILENSKELEKQVVTAIDEMKTAVAGLLQQKKELQQAAFDHISESNLASTKGKNLEKFNKIKQIVLEAKKQYEDANLQWLSCKSSYRLYREAN